jgi:uncharacterized protein GlcG (DUF336 family)/NAD-dependent dihydropyrimidine dehydrogenase PreA subunit
MGTTYVITEACIGVKDATCVDVCPAACIHTTPESPQYYIDPDVCIACEQCVLVCPVNAIFLDDEVPEHLQQYIEINARFFRENKAEALPLSPAQAEAIIAAAGRYADAAGFRVAIVVVDDLGAPLAKTESDGIDSRLPLLALDKAYTAALLQVATHQVRGGSAANSPAGFDTSRLVTQAGGYPALEGATIIGAIGVAGTPDPQTDLQCCMAGLSALQPDTPAHR